MLADVARIFSEMSNTVTVLRETLIGGIDTILNSSEPFTWTDENGILRTFTRQADQTPIVNVKKLSDEDKLALFYREFQFGVDMNDIPISPVPLEGRIESIMNVLAQSVVKTLRLQELKMKDANEAKDATRREMSNEKEGTIRRRRRLMTVERKGEENDENEGIDEKDKEDEDENRVITKYFIRLRIEGTETLVFGKNDIYNSVTMVLLTQLNECTCLLLLLQYYIRRLFPCIWALSRFNTTFWTNIKIPKGSMTNSCSRIWCSVTIHVSWSFDPRMLARI